MIELKDVSKVYDDRVLFENVNLKIDKPGLYSFIGENGAGKSTLLNIIAGNIKASKGKVRLTYKRKSFITQKINLIEHLTIKEHFNLFNLDYNLLRKVSLCSKLDNYPRELSFGQRQRIAAILCLYSHNEVVICDEPTSHLDYKSSLKIMKIIKGISKEKIVLLVSHNEEFVEKYSDQIYKIENQRVSLMLEKHLEEKNIESIKERTKFKGYLLKSIFHNKKINIFSVLVFFVAFFFLSLYFNFKDNIYHLINEEIEYSLDYNKFYVKECVDVKSDNLKVKECSNLNEDKIKKLNDDGYKIKNSYDILLNSLYKSNKFSVINSENYKLKEGRYPSRYNEIIATDKYNLNQIITLTSNELISQKKVDVYKNNLHLKVVGIIEEAIFYDNDKYYMDYNLTEEYLKNEILIGNNISLLDYYKNLEIDNYKYLIYLNNTQLDELNKLDVEYADNAYTYYENILLIIEEIDMCIIYLIIFIGACFVYYLIRIINKKIVAKENEINFLLANGINRKKVIKLINKENNFIALISSLIGEVFSLLVIKLVLKEIYINFGILLIVFGCIVMLNNLVVKVLFKKRIAL